MTAKLKAITPSYSSFKDDQVLTAGQLNELLNYFDDQDRMSRIFLSGVGIVCGFQPSLQTNGQTAPPGKKIIITQGCGVTTDGDLIKLSLPSDLPEEEGNENINIEEVIYTSFVSYSDEKAKYTPFFYTGTNQQIPLYELLPDGVTTPGSQPLDTFSGLENMIVLLYLESYTEEPTVCTGISCDDMGEKQVQKLRALLVSRTDVLNIIHYDAIFNYQNILNTYIQLPAIEVPRVMINQFNSQSPAELSAAYTKVITSTGIIKMLQAGFSLMLNKLGMNSLSQSILKQLDINFNPINAPVYFQYWYDLLKDVTDTYNEMKELFPEALCGCDPDITSFPKHLLLGSLKDLTENDLQYNNYRHSFLKSPLLSDFCSAQEQFEQLVDRVLEMLKANQGYKFPVNPVKVTPSKYAAPLGYKAIPFYYNLNNILLKKWNYEKTKRYKQKWNLSYHTSLLENNPIVQTPLSYNLEPYNFFCIEGHQGATRSSALEAIRSIKEKFGLNFDVLDLGISLSGTETINIEDYPCEFADLQVMLTTWRQSNSCVLSNTSQYLSSYSVDTSWKNPNLPVYYENKGKASLDLKALVNRQAETNAVYEKMDKTDGSVGKYIAESYKKFTGCSANDIINLALSEMAGINFRTFSPFAYDLTILKPVQILSNALLLFDNIPANIIQLDRTRYNNLVLNANNICVLARQTTGVINGDVAPVLPPASTPGSYMNSASYMQKYMPLADQAQASIEEYPGSFNRDYSYDFEVNRTVEKAPAMIPNIMEDLLKSCCNVKQIESILNEIERRKQQILLNKKLSEFVKKHPGLEHFRGARPGGTFIVVYTSTAFGEIPANTIIADFSLPYSCNCKCDI